MLSYDMEIFSKFKALSVQSVGDLEVGVTYYTNGRGSFTIAKLLTNSEEYTNEGLVWVGDDADKINWVLPVDGYSFSLSDRNVGASYSPWLIFKDEAVACQCEKELDIRYMYDPELDAWDDYATEWLDD